MWKVLVILNLGVLHCAGMTDLHDHDFIITYIDIYHSVMDHCIVVRVSCKTLHC